MSAHSRTDSLASVDSTTKKETKRKKVGITRRPQWGSTTPQQSKPNELRASVTATRTTACSTSIDNKASMLKTVGITNLSIHQAGRGSKDKECLTSTCSANEERVPSTGLRLGALFSNFPRNGIKRSSSIFVKKQSNSIATRNKKHSLVRPGLRAGVTDSSIVQSVASVTSTSQFDSYKLDSIDSMKIEARPNSVASIEGEAVLIEREPSKESVVSAWLLQCNNAAVVLDDTEEPVKEPRGSNVDTKLFDASENQNQLMSTSATFLPQVTEPGVEVVTSQRCFYPTELQLKFPDPVPSKLTESSNFIKSTRFTPRSDNLSPKDERFPKQLLGTNQDRNQSNQVTKTFTPSSALEEELCEKHDENSNHATDWASVSSSEWGDDMCEFDRQQAYRVQQMFEQIDRMLYDGSPGWRNKPIALPNQTTAQLDGSHSPVMQFEDEYNLGQLEGECQDWLQRFLHLRVVGVKVKLNEGKTGELSGHQFAQSSSDLKTGSPILPTLEHHVTERTQSISDWRVEQPGVLEQEQKCSYNLLQRSQSNTKLQGKSSDTFASTVGPCPSPALSDEPHTPTPTNATPEDMPVSFKRNATSDTIKHIHISVPSGNSESANIERTNEEVFGEKLPLSKSDLNVNKLKTAGRVPENNHSPSELFEGNAFPPHAPIPASSTGSLKHSPALKNCLEHERMVSLKHLLAEALRKDLTVWLQSTLGCADQSGPFGATESGFSDGSFMKPGSLPVNQHLQPGLYQGTDSEQVNHEKSLCLHGKELSELSTKTTFYQAATGRAQGSGHQLSTAVNELTDLLQISTKSLQHRERTLCNDAQDAPTLRAVQPSMTVSVAEHHSTEPVRTTRSPVPCRLSPHPHTCFPESGQPRTISGMQYKYPNFPGRKPVHPCAANQRDIGYGPPGSGIIGVAANLHLGGRLAPLDRTRASTNMPSSHQQQSEDHLTQPNATAVPPNISAAFSASRNKTFHHFPAATVSACAHTATSSAPMAIPVSGIFEPQSGRSCTLPPLCTTNQTLSTMTGVNAPQHPGPSLGNLPNTKVQHGTHSRAGAPVQSSSASTAHSTVQYAFPLPHQHTPALRIANSNLVTQQLNNSGVASPVLRKRQVRLKQPSNLTSVKSSSKRTPSQPKTCPRYWRPHSSVSPLPWMVEESQVFQIDRSRSTLLLPTCNVDVERNSPKRPVYLETRRINEEKIRSLYDRLK